MKKKKIKKIILSIIVSLIALISVFSCVKGKYTPEPILTPVSVLRPANSVNDNVISPTGTYDYIYINTSYDFDTWSYFVNDFSYDIYLPSGTIPAWEGIDKYFYPLYIDSVTGESIMLSKSIYLNDSSSPVCNLDILNINTFVNTEYIVDNINAEPYWRLNSNPIEISLSNGVTTFNFMGNDYPVGAKNNLFINIISPVPFLFEGTTTNIQKSTGFPENDVESVYINTNYTNVALKDIINTKIGYNDVSFTLTSDTQNYTIRINNTTYECYIYLNNEYIYIYDYTNTAPDVYWWGYSPITLDNRPLLYNVDLYTISGWNQDYSFLFSEVDDFGLVDPTYEEGYLDGKNDVINNPNSYGLYTREQYDNRYNYGYENGYTSGVNNVTSNPQEYNLYTYQQYNEHYDTGYNNGYDEGYLEGLDDGAGTNINFQYVESVLNLVGNFLNIEVLPGVKLSYALGVIIILTIISIIKMVVK